MLLVLVLLAAVPSSTTSSYVRLEGPRLTRFEKSKGKSELGALVKIEVEGKALATLEKLPVNERYGVFEAKSVRYLVDRTDPALAQAQRKIERSKKKLKLLIRGKVVRQRLDRDKDPAIVVRVDGLRAIGVLR